LVGDENIGKAVSERKVAAGGTETINVIAHQGVLDEGVAFIQKPFSMADMTMEVRKLLDKASDETQ
jgi:hypothetical protein